MSKDYNKLKSDSSTGLGSAARLRVLADSIEKDPPRISVPPKSPMQAGLRVFRDIPPNHRIIAFLSLVVLAGLYVLRQTL